MHKAKQVYMEESLVLFGQISNFQIFEIYQVGGHLPHFQKFSIFALKLQKSRFYTFLHNLNFRKFLGPGYPYVPLYPYDPPKTENFENFELSQIMSTPFFWRFKSISENFLKNFALPPKALFREKSRFSAKSAKMEKYWI